jgi:hypothetical protein
MGFWNISGQAYLLLAKLNEARDEFHLAIDDDDKYVPALLGLANTYSRLRTYSACQLLAISLIRGRKRRI